MVRWQARTALLVGLGGILGCNLVLGLDPAERRPQDTGGGGAGASSDGGTGGAGASAGMGGTGLGGMGLGGDGGMAGAGGCDPTEQQPLPGTDVVVNGSFENNGDWISTGNPISLVADARCGCQAAEIAVEPNDYFELRQMITLPRSPGKVRVYGAVKTEQSLAANMVIRVEEGDRLQPPVFFGIPQSDGWKEASATWDHDGIRPDWLFTMVIAQSQENQNILVDCVRVTFEPD